MIAAILLYGLALYALIGIVTTGARILFLPGAAALWPYVLVRWLNSLGAR
jgi:hypothetical protein